MMPGSINQEAQRRRKKEAWISAVSFSVLMLLTGLFVLWMKFYYEIEAFWGVVMILAVILDWGMIPPTLILLKQRLKEIEGGEEDAAAQY